jgi:hypothetical protein
MLPQCPQSAACVRGGHQPSGHPTAVPEAAADSGRRRSVQFRSHRDTRFAGCGVRGGLWCLLVCAGQPGRVGAVGQQRSGQRTP